VVVLKCHIAGFTATEFFRISAYLLMIPMLLHVFSAVEIYASAFRAHFAALLVGQSPQSIAL